MFRFDREGFRFDLLWAPKPGAQMLFVLFSGDALREKFDPPVFQRWSWAPAFPGHCLYVADPSIHLDETLGLAWYAGTKDFDPAPTIAATVREFADAVGVPLRSVVSYGSSGGGFAALRLLGFLPDMAAVAVNPQIVVTLYRWRHVEKYLSLCFGIDSRDDALRLFPERLSVLHYLPEIRNRRITYIQNTHDHYHLQDHFALFCSTLGVSADENPHDGSFRRLLFADERGHGGAEPEQLFRRAMAIMTQAE